MKNSSLLLDVDNEDLQKNCSLLTELSGRFFMKRNIIQLPKKPLFQVTVVSLFLKFSLISPIENLK